MSHLYDFKIIKLNNITQPFANLLGNLFKTVSVILGNVEHMQNSFVSSDSGSLLSRGSHRNAAESDD